LPCVAHVHFDADGAQHVMLKAAGFHVAIVVSGPLVTLGPVRMHFSAGGISSLDTHIDVLGAIAHVLLQRKLTIAPDRTAISDCIHLRNAMIAIDGERAGATRREIATVIYGAKEVASKWSKDDGRMKAVIKRDVLRGRRLVAGGWRNMVAGGTFSAIA
jgi:hypothetical protein